MASVDIAGMLPDIPDLVRISKAIAMLDAIVCEDWSLRYYSFNSHWDTDDPAQMMASMRDGCGDHYFIWFSPVGAALKGFAHESTMSPVNNSDTPYPGIFDGIPSEFSGFLEEPAFIMDDTIFCFWRRQDDSAWHSGKVKLAVKAGTDPDGAKGLLSILDGKPSTYVEFASDYYEVDIDEEDVKHVYKLKPLTVNLLARLGCERSLDELSDDIEEIGYSHE